ncbi:MAG TPA: PrsW family intramembrane metalloprotease [Aeromicrobium sp.]|nr:PrsW family intramembrane metalloprotease [Aeromicrobium sp.]
MTTAPVRAELPKRIPRYKDTPRQRGRAALILLVILTAIAGVLGGIGISFSAGNPYGAGLSMFYAFFPLPALWLAYWWLDRYEPEPPRYKYAAFIWGGVVAVTIALSLQLAIQQTFHLSDETMATIVAPATEEPAKCLFLLLTFVRMRRVIDGFIDGLVYAGLVGIGFALVENIGYYAASYLGSADMKLAGATGATATFVMRGIFSPLAHPGFTSAFGIALGLAVGRFARRSLWFRALIALLGFCVSVGLHALWNSSLAFGGGQGFFVTYLALAGMLLALAVFAIVVRHRQVRTLERSLQAISSRGWIHPDEIPFLSRFTYRKSARLFARQHHGRVAGKLVRRYQRLATEVAFLHHGVVSGRNIPMGVERTYALLDAMYSLRPYLRFPPALAPVSNRADGGQTAAAVH